MKNDEINNLIIGIDKGEIKLEDLLQNSDFIYPTVKSKFPKFIKFFKEDTVVTKLINYSLNFDANNSNWKTFSHNSCEILSQVKNNSFVSFLTQKENDFIYISKIFNFVDDCYSKKNKEGITMDVEDIMYDNEEYADSLLSGYFYKILCNFILKKKKRVRYKIIKLFRFMFHYKPEYIQKIIFLSNFDENFQNLIIFMMQMPSDTYLLMCQTKLIELLLEYVIKYDYNANSFKNIFLRLLSIPEVYHKIFFENKKIMQLFSKVLLKLIEKDDNNDGNSKKKVSMKKIICNIHILEVLIKLSQNMIIDLEYKLKSKKEKKNTINLNNLKLKKQNTLNTNEIDTDETNYHLTINNPIDMSISGVNFKKPRVTILSFVDLETEIPSENDDSDENDSISDEKCFTVDFNVEEELFIILAKSLQIVLLSYNDYYFKGKTTFGYENLKKLEYFNNVLEIYIDSNFLSYVMNNNRTDNLTTNNILTEELTKDFESLDKFHVINSELLSKFFEQTYFSFNKYDKNSLLHKEVEIMTSLLSLKFCPDIFTETFAKESKSFQIIIENINSLDEKNIPINLSNQCEIVTRLFTSDNRIILSAIEESKYFIFLDKLLLQYYNSFYFPIYEKMKLILIDPKTGKSESENENENLSITKEESFKEHIKILDKENLKDFIHKCIKNSKNKSDVKLDIKLIKYKTQTLISKSTVSLVSRPSNIYNTQMLVDEVNSLDNIKRTKDLSNALEEMFDEVESKKTNTNIDIDLNDLPDDNDEENAFK